MLSQIDTSRIKIFRGHTDSVNTIAFSIYSDFIVSGSEDHTLRLWRVSDGTSTIFKEHTGPVSACLFSPTDNGMFISASDDGTIKHWDLNKGLCFYTFRASAPRDKSGKVLALAFSPDGSKIAYGLENGKVCLYNNSDGTELRTVGEMGYPVHSIAFSPNGRGLVASSNFYGFKYWDVISSFSTSLEQEMNTKDFAGCTYNNTNLSILSVSQNGTLIQSDWLSTEMRFTHIIKPPFSDDIVWDAVFSPTKRFILQRLCVPRANDVRVMDLNNKPVATLVTSLPTKSIAFSPDEKLIALGKGKHNSEVELWSFSCRADASSRAEALFRPIVV